MEERLTSKKSIAAYRKEEIQEDPSEILLRLGSKHVVPDLDKEDDIEIDNPQLPITPLPEEDFTIDDVYTEEVEIGTLDEQVATEVLDRMDEVVKDLARVDKLLYFLIKKETDKELSKNVEFSRTILRSSLITSLKDFYLSLQGFIE